VEAGISGEVSLNVFLSKLLGYISVIRFAPWQVGTWALINLLVRIFLVTGKSVQIAYNMYSSLVGIFPIESVHWLGFFPLLNFFRQV